MKNFIFLSIILIFTFFVVLLQLGGQKTESNTKIEEENRAEIIKNPVESRHGEFELDLEKDLVIGSDIISFTPLDIKRGYLYHTIYSEDTGEVRVLRYKIRNWEQIKEYVQE